MPGPNQDPHSLKRTQHGCRYKQLRHYFIIQMEGSNKEKIIKHLSNTTSNVKLDNTITKPDAKKVINAVATILHSQMVEDAANPKKIDEKSDLFFFSEEKYILERPEEYNESRKALLREMPTIDSIAEFMNALYECGQFSIECCVVCLVYINRFISITEMPLQPTNWRPLVLCALLEAQKVWDDRYLSNADFAYIYPFFKNEEVNKLELKFLELIEYNVNVKQNVYVRYYFELKTLFKADENFPLTPLTQEKAQELQATAKKVETDGKQRSATMNMGQQGSKAKLVLS